MADDEKSFSDQMSDEASLPALQQGSDHFEGEISYALQSYLRQLGRIPRLTPEEQDGLSQAIVAAEDRWRKTLYSFGMTASWHLDFLSGKDVTQLRDCIMPSCLPDGINMQELLQWRNALQGREATLHCAFENGASGRIAETREALIAHLMRYKLFSDILMECHDKLSMKFPTGGEGVFNALAEQSSYTLEEFRAALKRADEARTELLDLRQKMVEGNLRLVVRIVNQYSYRQLSVGDLVQEGNLGLMRSLEKFDFNLGHKFSTYASWWIRQSIGRAMAEQFRIIRIPAHMVATIAAINRAEQRFILEHDRLPEVEEIAAMLEMPTPRVSAIRKMARQTISLQSPLSVDDSGSSLEDVLPDDQAHDPAKEVSQETTFRHLQRLLDELSEREREILVMRFGLMGQKVRTLQEISEHFNISRERVRQLELQTLNKLRTPENRRMFGADYI